MTHPQHTSSEEMLEELVEDGIVPMKVHVEKMPPRSRARIYSSYVTIVVSSTNGSIEQLVGQDRKRTRVLIWADAKVLIGQQNEVGASKGATYDPAKMTAPIVLHNQQEIWVASTGVAANVSVIVEREA